MATQIDLPLDCSRCASLQEASVLLEEMRLFDSRVYGVAHGLLMGSRQHVWGEAEGLFDEIARMDYATGAAFYNALTDVLWHFGQVWTISSVQFSDAQMTNLFHLASNVAFFSPLERLGHRSFYSNFVVFMHCRGKELKRLWWLPNAGKCGIIPSGSQSSSFLWTCI